MLCFTVHLGATTAFSNVALSVVGITHTHIKTLKAPTSKKRVAF